MNNVIEQITIHLQSLTKKEFSQYLMTLLTGIAILAFGITYYSFHASALLTEKIKKLNEQANKAALILATNEQLQAEELKIRDLLDKNPEPDLNSYCERFFTQHNLTAEKGWKAEDGTIIDSSEEGIKFQEIFLKAIFKNQTMQNLVAVLQEIYKDKMIYLKALEITNTEPKITFELTLATKKYVKETTLAA